MENKYLIDKHENSESKYQITNFCPIFVIRKHNLNKNEKFEILWNVCLCTYATIFSEIKHFLIILVICTFIHISISYFNYNICGNHVDVKIYIKIQSYKIYPSRILEIWVSKIQMHKYEYIRYTYIHYSYVFSCWTSSKKNLVKSSSTFSLVSSKIL